MSTTNALNRSAKELPDAVDDDADAEADAAGGEDRGGGMSSTTLATDRESAESGKMSSGVIHSDDLRRRVAALALLTGRMLPIDPSIAVVLPALVGQPPLFSAGDVGDRSKKRTHRSQLASSIGTSASDSR